jgi:AcrR family transcriptional regulator
MSTDDPEAGISPSLRERRRRETAREISLAALELFEQRGLSATVEDIAKAAGVSPRTFFRYFPTKEDAVLRTDFELDDALEAAIESIKAGEKPATALEQAWFQIFAEFENQPKERALALRTHHLIGTEPHLLAAALRRDAERAEDLTTRVAEAIGADPRSFDARAIVEFSRTVVRLTLDEWARRNSEQGGLHEIYCEAAIALKAAAG